MVLMKTVCVLHSRNAFANKEKKIPLLFVLGFVVVVVILFHFDVFLYCCQFSDAKQGLWKETRYPKQG